MTTRNPTVLRGLYASLNCGSGYGHPEGFRTSLKSAGLDLSRIPVGWDQMQVRVDQTAGERSFPVIANHVVEAQADLRLEHHPEPDIVITIGW